MCVSLLAEVSHGGNKREERDLCRLHFWMKPTGFRYTRLRMLCFYSLLKTSEPTVPMKAKQSFDQAIIKIGYFFPYDHSQSDSPLRS